jgi:hypothetical protein
MTPPAARVSHIPDGDLAAEVVVGGLVLGATYTYNQQDQLTTAASPAAATTTPATSPATTWLDVT